MTNKHARWICLTMFRCTWLIAQAIIGTAKDPFPNFADVVDEERQYSYGEDD